MNSACGTYGVEEKCDLVGNTVDREHTGILRRRWENNIQVNTKNLYEGLDWFYLTRDG
jgi:hypothetical protein